MMPNKNEHRRNGPLMRGACGKRFLPVGDPLLPMAPMAPMVPKAPDGNLSCAMAKRGVPDAPERSGVRVVFVRGIY